VYLIVGSAQPDGCGDKRQHGDHDAASSPTPRSSPMPPRLTPRRPISTRCLRRHQRQRATSYDGTTDDLLTAGLGKTKLGSAVAPASSTRRNPTAAELRRRAIYTNFAPCSTSSVAGGFGTLYGPNIDITGADTLGEGLVAARSHRLRR